MVEDMMKGKGRRENIILYYPLPSIELELLSREKNIIQNIIKGHGKDEIMNKS